MHRFSPSRLIIAGLITASVLQFHACSDTHAAQAERSRAGLVALYDFQSATGDVVQDRSGAGKPLNLKISNSKAVRRSAGVLEITGPVSIQSEGSAAKITEAVQRSRELTIETWLQPASLNQSGPARIVSLSKDPNSRNFTLGQDGQKLELRLRTTGTSENGIPATSSPDRLLKTELTHVVWICDRNGKSQLFVNGKLVKEAQVPGQPTNWDAGLKLTLANEITGDRPWLGTLHLVAVYSRALLSNEVAGNFQAGAAARGPASLAKATGTHPEALRLFETEIAPLLAEHCFECHDSTTRKGKLDLSRKSTAFADRKGGHVIIPGKASQSPLWKSIEANEMPEDRPPLSAREKELFRQWIDSGAVWTTEVIDPAIFANSNRMRQQFVRRLTLPEYVETVRAAVGVDIAEEAGKLLPPDKRADGFNNTAYNLGVDLSHVEAYAQLAEIIVNKLDVAAFARRFESGQRFSDDKAVARLVEKMGRWLLRGPLDEREVLQFLGIMTAVNSASGDFTEGTRYLIEAFLQSPRFIYRIENQRGDGSAWPVADHELASRLSYTLWGGPPDSELVRATDAGELRDRTKLGAQVQRMLKDPRTIERSAQFLTQWLDLDRLDHLRPDPKKFPNWNAGIARDMREETLAFFKEVAWTQKRPLADLLNSQVTFASPSLAAFYGLKPAAPADGSTPVRYDLAGVPGRGGLLTHGSVLTVGGDEASMVSRGLFVLKDILRGSVKDPPPCVDTTPVATKRGLTQRAIAEERLANGLCGGCHVKFEPLAFGLEKFDGVGAYFDRDKHGNKLRDDGEILFPGTEKPVKYRTSAELMNLLASSPRVRETMTWKIVQFSLGRPLGALDVPALEEIHRTTQDHGGTYASVLTALVLSDLVQKTRTEAN